MLAFWAFAPAFAAASDLLNDGPTDPCQAGADYVPGTDAQGRPVIPADVGQAKVPVPDEVTVPLPARRNGRRGGQAAGQPQGPYVSLDGRKLEPLLNPKPCR